MSPGAELQYDHDVLRAKLEILEGYLPQLDELQCSALCLTNAIAASLRAHAEREEAFVGGLPLGRLHPDVQELRDEHTNQRMRLAVLHALLAERMPQAKEQVVEQAAQFIADLRAHMVKEAALYEAAECVTGLA